MRSIYQVLKPTGRFHRARRLLAGSVMLAGAIGAGSAAMARPSLVTLIDLSSLHNGPAIASCPSALSDLRDALDAIGIPTQRMSAPTADTLRLTLAQISGQTGAGRMIVVCGYGASPNDQVFIVPTDGSAGGADISRSGVSADTIARVAGSGSLTALELHPLPGGDLSDDLVSKWQAAASPGTSRLAGVDRNAGDAAVIARLTAAVKGQGDAMLSAFFGVQPQAGAPVASPPPPPPPPPPSPAPVAAASPKAVAPPPPPPSHVAATDATHPVPPPPASSGSKTSASGTVAPAPSPEPPTGAAAAVPPASLAPDAAASHAVAPVAAAHPPAVSRPAAVRRAAPKRAEVAKATPETRSLQLGLLAAGVYHGTVTGKNNAATTQAIQLYQKKLGHQPSGQLTPEERKALTGG